MRERDTETETENQILVQKGSALAYHTDTPIEPQSFPTDHLIFFLATTTYLPGGYGYSTGKPSEEGLDERLCTMYLSRFAFVYKLLPAQLLDKLFIPNLTPSQQTEG